MRKTLTVLSLAAALFAGQAVANETTLSHLRSCGVQLSVAQITAITTAEGQQLVNVISELVAAQPRMAGSIAAAAVSANPSQAAAIQAAAIQAAPAQEQAINTAIASGEGCAVSTGDNLPSTSLPTISGTELASPN